MQLCPCGSGLAASACCTPIIAGLRPAASAEALMRARYSAYVTVAIDFITSSTHPDYRHRYDPAAAQEWAERAEWLGLEILACSGGSDDDRATVEFVARFREAGQERRHHELASFVRRDGEWYFTEGEQVKAQPLTVTKIGRNDPCPCGSGRKYKKCCGQ